MLIDSDPATLGVFGAKQILRGGGGDGLHVLIRGRIMWGSSRGEEKVWPTDFPGIEVHTQPYSWLLQSANFDR